MSNQLYVWDESGFVAVARKADPLNDRRVAIVNDGSPMPFPGQVVWSKLEASPLRALMPWSSKK